MSLNPGDVIDGKYQIVRLLGEGGMGAVYEGLNVRIHRRVAIKVLHGKVASSPEAVQRFEREAQAAGRIGSSHIVEVLDLGDLPDGDRYMVMEFLDGQSLADRVQARGKLPPEEIYPIAVQLLEGLAAAHAAGIVHRDLKPDNVYLITSKRDGEKDFVKILDFGISKFNTLGGEFSMTRTGAVMGTPYYMSPEQAKGARELDQRADLYAVGVILYECSSGRVPFQAQTFNELLFKIVLEEPPPLRDLQQNLDEGFIAVVSKAMAREAGERYQSAAEFQRALQDWAEGAGLGKGGVTGHTLPFGAARPAPPAAAPPSAPTPADGAAEPANGGTAPGWSNTQADAETVPPTRARRGKPPLWLLAGAAISLGAAAVATVLWSARDESASATSAVSTDGAAASADADEARAALEAERKAAEEARRAAEKELAEARAASEAQKAAEGAGQGADAASPAGATSASAAQEPPQPKPAPLVQAAKKRPAPAPTTKPVAGPAPTPPAPPPASTTDNAKTSAGRTIRSTL
jgi:serine/threonine-protein kinase